MSFLEALLLGILQGATEFLPVSSSGHLVVIPALLGMAVVEENLIAIAHQGTLVAALIYFRGDVWAIATAVLDGLQARKPLGTTNARLGWYIVVASAIVAVIGLALESQIEAIFAQPIYAGFFLLGTAALLLIGERLASGATTLAAMSWTDSLVIGLAQVLALLPGISRSGSTIAAGLARGLDRNDAARYAFLVGLPAIFGAGLLALNDLRAAPDVADQITPLAVTFLAAAVSGYACIHWLLRWVRTHTLRPFAVYCTALALFFLAFTALT